MNNALTINDIQNDMIGSPMSIPNRDLDNSDIRTLKEVEAAIVSAKKFPRNEDLSIQKIRRACGRSRLAESAIYQYPRGGTVVQGASIRLAETVALHWGNIQKGVRELSVTKDSTTYEAFAYDVENNVRASRIFTVKHQRYSRNNGNTDLIDPRDIYEVIMSHAARRLRACILEIIPQDIIEEALEVCEDTIAKSHNKEPIEDRREKMIGYFKSEFKVESELIKERYSKNIEALNNHDLMELKKIAQSLKDGMSSPKDWFKSKDEKTKNSTDKINESFGSN